MLSPRQGNSEVGRALRDQLFDEVAHLPRGHRGIAIADVFEVPTMKPSFIVATLINRLRTRAEVERATVCFDTQPNQRHCQIYSGNESASGVAD